MSRKRWFSVFALTFVAFITIGSFPLPAAQSAEGQTVAAKDPFMDVPAPEFLIRTEKEVRGRHVNLDVDFSSVLSGGYVEVEIQLNKTGKSFIAMFASKPEWELVTLHIVPWQGGDPQQVMRKTLHDETLLVTFYRTLALELDPSKRDPSVTERYPPIEVEAKLLGFLGLLIDFIPRDQYLEGFDKRLLDGSRTQPDVAPQSAIEPLVITRICEVRGELHTATFTVGSQTLTPSVKVGDPASQCLGRCGIGCIHTSDQGHPRNYTQDCLNHDVCARVTGGILGECSGEFSAASDDFFSLLGCPHFIIGTWDVATNLGCDLTSNFHRILIRRNGTFSKCGGTGGTWNLLGDDVTVNHLATGAVSTGMIDATDLRMRDTSTGLQDPGCWSARHLTTDELC